MNLGQEAQLLVGLAPVFAAHSVRPDGACTCTDKHLCRNIGKHPRFYQRVKDRDSPGDLAHGRDSATTDVTVIATWWARWPEANIGLATGDGLLVVDLDGPDGLALQERLPETLRARTGRPDGGEHWYFEVPEGIRTRNRAKLMTGMDVRGDGGYVIAPPSLHASGGRYSWIDPSVPIAACPLWVLELAREPEAPPREIVAPAIRTDRDTSAYARAALEAEVQRVLDAGRGTQNDTLNTAAFSLGQLVGGGVLPESVVETALLDAWDALEPSNGPGMRAGEKTIRSGLEAGMRQPRTAPERPPERRKAPEGAPSSASAHPPEPIVVAHLEPEQWSSPNGHVLPSRVEYPLGVWPSQVAEFIEATALSVCVAPEAVGTAVLAIAAGAIGHARWLAVKDDWIERPGIYAGLVAASGERKSPALRAAAAPVETIQSEHIAKWKREMEQWESAPSKKKPELSGPLMKDVTTEAVAAALMSHPRGVILLRDELVGFVRSMGQYKQGRGDDRQKWLEAWSGGTMLVRRRGSDPIAIEKPCLSVLGGIQPAVFDGLRAEDDGLAERFLYDVMPVVPLRASTPAVPRAVRGTWEGIVRELYGLPEREVVCEAEGCLTEARQRALDAREAVPAPLRAYAGKGEAHLARLAIVLATVWAVTGSGDGQVDSGTVARAEDLLGFYMDQAERLFCGDVVPVRAYVVPGPSSESDLVRWLRVQGGQASKRDAMHKGPLQRLSSKDADQLIFTAVARGQISVETERPEHGGPARTLLRLMEI